MKFYVNNPRVIADFKKYHYFQNNRMIKRKMIEVQSSVQNLSSMTNPPTIKII